MKSKTKTVVKETILFSMDLFPTRKTLKMINITIVSIFAIAFLRMMSVVNCQAELSQDSFFPEFCLTNFPSNYEIHAETVCSHFNSIDSKVKFNQTVCYNEESESRIRHSFQSFQREYISGASSCPTNGSLGPVKYENQTHSYGFWHCSDNIGDRIPECTICETTQNVSGCYGDLNTYRNNMRPNHPCVSDPSENTTACLDNLDCNCSWFCAETIRYLIDPEEIIDPLNSIDSFDAIMTSSRFTNQAFEIECHNVSWAKVNVVASNENLVIQTFISFDGKFVKVVVEPTGTYQIVIIKTDFQIFREFSGTNFEFQLPANVRQTSGVLVVEIFSAGGKLDSASFTVVGFSSCDIADCLWCGEFFETVGCLPFVLKIAVLVLFSASILLTIIAIPCFGIVIFALWKFICWAAGFFKNTMMFMMKKNPIYTKLKEKIDEMELTKTTESTPNEVIEQDKSAFEIFVETQKRRTRNMKGTNSACLFLIAIIMMPSFIKDVRGCDNGLLIPISVQNCVVNGQTETCTASFEVEIGLPFDNSISCLTLTDSDKQNVYATLNVTLLDVLYSQNLNLQYFTSARDVVVESHRFCYDFFGGFCHDKNSPFVDACSSVNDNPSLFQKVIRGTNLLSNSKLSNPGVSSCRRNSGGLLSGGCGAPNDACIVSRASVVPKGEAFSVLKASSISDYSARLGLSLKTTSGLISSECKGRGISCSLGNFTLFIDDVVSTSVIELPGCIFKSQGKKSTLGSCSNSNVFNPGEYGEIQSESISKLNNGTFSTAPGIFTLAENGNENNYLTVPSPFRLGRLDLPNFIDNVFFFEDGGKVHSNVSGSVRARLKTQRPITISRKTSLVCPVVKLESASGCSQCSDGATITIKAKSSCAEGSVVVSTTDKTVSLSTNHAELSLDEKIIIVRASLSKVDNNFVLIFGKGEKSVSLTVILEAPISVNISNNSYVVSKGSIKDEVESQGSLDFDIGDFFTRSFLGRGSTLETIVTVAIIILGVIIMATLTALLIKKGLSYESMNRISASKKQS